MKEKLDVFKYIWSVPRYKALIELSLYIIFFIIILILSKVFGVKENINYEDDKYPYYFNTTIDGDEIIGTIYENKIEINVRNTTYYYENGIISPELFPYPLIVPYIDYYKVMNNEIYSKTEYNNGVIEEQYNLDNNIITINKSDDIILNINDGLNIYTLYYSK